MIDIFKNIFGTQNEREIKRLEPLVQKINDLEYEFSKLSDDQVRDKIERIKKDVQKALEEARPEIEKVRQTIFASTSEQTKNKHKKSLKEIKSRLLDDRLPEVFAAVRESGKRTIGLRHFDVQLIGGIVLHEGRIAEMTTGEGKTLVATLAASLNAVLGESVHVVTVNDYLAKRDSEWMSPVYKFLGFSVGVIQNSMRPEERKNAYRCDVVYGTNNEFGFDYLRDNMITEKEEKVQSFPSFAIVDEVDSILIDEARTPLIISGAVDETNESYNQMRPVVGEIVKAQKMLVRDYLAALRGFTTKGDKEKIGEMLYLIHKADPKNKDFLDIILKDRESKTMFDKVQGLLDSKIMEKERDTLLEELFYVFDEKNKEATFSAKGQKLMKERFNIEFMLDDIETGLEELAGKDMPEEEKNKAETDLISSYADQQRKVESIKQLLKAYILFQKDVDYVVSDNKIVIVDGFTGRMMPGRRFSDGIHEALEAKERVEVQRESQTLATITLQNWFRMYDKLAGMTGTAKTEESEFENIYLLPVVQVPTNRPLKRENMPDRIYKTGNEKFKAVVDDIAHWHEKGRPLLVGTISIEKSEHLSRLLTSRGIRHNVLNAKYHETEAHIIAQAGRYGAVTIATNMAGRGTDILLGGNPESLANDAVDKISIDDPDERKRVFEKFFEEFKKTVEKEKQSVLETGGLHVIGTERHEARRIDNQLRGRSGRQGDPGSSRFYLSLEDDLMRIFGSDRIKSVMDRLGMEEGEVIENPLVTRAIRTAQHRVESQNFEIRKHLLKYDNVMNQQREVIYKRRRMVLEEEDLKTEFFECLFCGIEALLQNWEEDPQPEVFVKDIMYRYALNIRADSIRDLSPSDVRENVLDAARKSYAVREKFLGRERLQDLAKIVMLSLIDTHWKEYLREIDDLREGISWRAYAQKDPLVEFQHEAFRMFSELIAKIDDEIAERIMKISAQEEEHRKRVFEPKKEVFEHKNYSAMKMPEESPQMGESTYRRDAPKVGRNDLCPCGSGKKHKKCCGR
ncbi:MAG: preprotein translocase subunit SecA [Candidatus Omnitrophota bacterium]